MRTVIPKFIVISIIFSIFTISFCTDWRIGLTLYPTSLDSAYIYRLYFGQRFNATDEYDPFVDVAMPPPPPDGFFPYIHGDSIISSLREDYRSDESWNCLWQLSFIDEPGESVSVVWESDSFPFTIEPPIYMQYIVSDTIPADSDWDSANSIADVESVFVSCEQSVFFKFRNYTAIKENYARPSDFLFNVFPNPFNSSCEITISDSRGLVRQTLMYIAIYDLRGNMVFTNTVGARSPRPMQEGTETVPLQNRTRTFIWMPDKSISSGIYFVRVETENGNLAAKRIVYIK